MALFGLVSQKEHEKLMKEIEALKAARTKFESWQLNTADAEHYTMPDPSQFDSQADLYRKLSWVLLAVDITAKAAALVKFSVARIISGKEPKDIPNHDLETLINNPNELDSRYEFLYATIAYYALTGNAYWWVNAESENDVPSELWLIPSNMIIPVPDEKMYLRGYLYYPGNGMEILFQPHEIVHFKRFNINSRFIGLSAIEAIAMVAAGDLGMQKYNTTLFANNNGRLPSVMTFEQMIADPTWDKIKSDTREASRNREMLMLRGVGQGGVNWLQNAVSQREMEFLEGRRANKEEIMTTVAPGSFTMLSENATQANSVVGRAAFNELTVYPMLEMMGQKISNSLLKRYGGRPLVGRFEDIRVTDKDMKLREQEAFERSHTLKEVREEIYGDDPLGDERDKLMISEMGKASINEPPPPQMPENNAMPDNMQAQPTQEPNQNESIKAAFVELSRWQRWAVSHAGKGKSFSSAVLNTNILDYLNNSTSAAKSEIQIKAIYENAREMVQHNTKDAAVILEGIRLGIMALEKK